MNRKIGILTHYYKSNNYGGNLQAFALVYFLRKHGFDAEQISIPLHFTSLNKREKHNNVLFKMLNLKKVLRFITHKYEKFLRKTLLKHSINERKKAIEAFNLSIPHSKEYNEESILLANNEYDCFIVGSDQVWNLDWYFPPFFLDFVASDKVTISYAASLGYDTLSPESEHFFKQSLSNFDYISVREKESMSILQKLTKQPISLTLDPTYLLDCEDWISLCRINNIKGKYVFCYFLGQDRGPRKVAKRYAKKNNLELVTIPHLNGVTKSDLFFGKHKLYGVDPIDFITLVKDSECVITDSFHACVFSTIFKKNFYAFGRSGINKMSSRIRTLTEYFDCKDHFIENSCNVSLKCLDLLKPIDYKKDHSLFNKIKVQSIFFLKKALSN